jgi:putative ABC transport system substrate-binding protein
VRRRDVITLLGGAALWPVAARAQVSPRRPLVAWLSGGAQAASSGFVDAFLQGMRDQGYAEGRDVDIVYRYADGYAERLPALAQELVRLKPNVILAPATAQAVAAKNATTTIPIVTPALADAVHLGLVASESRPQGNVTGITPYVAGLPAKQMELAREVVPRARRIGVLGDTNDPKAAPQWLELQDAGRALGVDVIVAQARTPNDLAGAFQALADQRPDAVIVLQTSMLLRRAPENRGAGSSGAPAGRLWLSRACRGRRPDQLRGRSARLLPPFRRLRRQDLARHVSWRSAGGVSDQARADHQSENGQGAPDRNSADPARPRR